MFHESAKWLIKTVFKFSNKVTNAYGNLLMHRVYHLILFNRKRFHNNEAPDKTAASFIFPQNKL